MTLADYGINDLKEAIWIDVYAEYLLGDDQACLDYPTRFPTVEFELVSTLALTRVADQMRKALGYLPMLEDGGDTEGWYCFYLGLNGFVDSHVDTSIMFVVENSDSADNEQMYFIPLSEGEQRAIYKILDEQCRRYYGRSCEDLLEDARREMENENH